MDRKVFFEELNGKKVFCVFRQSSNDSKKLVIMSHGFRGSSIGPARQFVDFETLLNGGDFSVLRFDQPNSGNSSGDFLDSSFSEWVNTIAYFANKYINDGYKVALLGQSMGATATVVATDHPLIVGKIPTILLWVPDAKTTITETLNKRYEEGGQQYKGIFWKEAKESNFFQCLQKYNGGIHLVYGETDKYVERPLIDQTVEIVKSKNQPIMILKGQEHSSWEYDVVQNVYKEEIKKLKEYL